MSKAPIVYRSTHRIKFSELDPYDHVNTGQYATYYVAYCMEGLRDYAGWDLKTLATLPFMVWVRRMEIREGAGRPASAVRALVARH
jgi:acyl-CoA thioester hydrolase